MASLIGGILLGKPLVSGHSLGHGEILVAIYLVTAGKLVAIHLATAMFPAGPGHRENFRIHVNGYPSEWPLICGRR